jgi:hypothetical protein
MKKQFWLIVAAGSSFFILGLSAYVIPEFVCLLLFFLVFAVLVVFLIFASIVGFISWRKSSRLWPVPALVCLAFILCTYYLISPIGQYISDWRFEKNLAEYSKVVDDLKNGTIACAIPCNAKFGMIKAPSQPALIRNISGARCNDNGVVVLFLSDTDVPLVHVGYLYKDYGEKSDCLSRSLAPDEGTPHLPYLRHITENWYRFSDQPGF